MNRRDFLKSAAAIAAPAQHRPPNVLFILADEWRAQATGYNGDGNTHTPVLNRLASHSTSFDCAISGTPVCCPFRASLMTGQYPLTNGVFINDVELKPSGTTLAQSFAKAGYHTGFIGKWHLYGSPDGNYGRRLLPVPPDKHFGFDYWKAAECSHEYNQSLYYEGSDPTPRYWTGYDAFAQTADACSFIERQSQPWFLMLSMGPPHFPYGTAPEPYREMYRQRPITLRANVPAQWRDEATNILRGYYAHMAALDACFARLLGTLDRLRIAEDTIVVFTSDHGDMMRSQGLTTKLYPWDESIRVPFLLRYPRAQKHPSKIRTPFNAPDIMPTLLQTCNLPIPDGVQGTAYPDGDAALISLPVPMSEARKFGFAEYRGIRTERHTYVRSIHGPWLLYDNQRDPLQMHNLCNAERSLRQNLDKVLDAKLKSVNDDFLPAAEYIRRAGVGHYHEVTQRAGRVKSPWGDWESTMRPN